MQAKDEFTRKRAARQKRLRKRRLITALVFIIILLAGTGIILSLTVFFPIETVKISGSGKYTYEELFAAAGINNGDNLFMVSQKNTESSLRKALPYVESIKIKRILPGTIDIIVKDAKEYICYNISGKYYSVSENSRVLNSYEAQPDGIAEIRASGVKCAVGSEVEFSGENTKELISSVLEKFESANLKINYIDITDEFNIKVKTEGRFIVTLGTANYLENKIKHLSGMINNIASDKTGNINLSMWTSGNTEGTFVESDIK